MKRKSKEVEVNGENYLITELRVRDMMDLMPRFSDEAQAAEATLDLMKLCVSHGGKLLGDKVEDIGMSAYMALSEHVMEVNGLAGKG